jgi:hypothetical protein
LWIQWRPNESDLVRLLLRANEEILEVFDRRVYQHGLSLVGCARWLGNVIVLGDLSWWLKTVSLVIIRISRIQHLLSLLGKTRWGRLREWNLNKIRQRSWIRDWHLLFYWELLCRIIWGVLFQLYWGMLQLFGRVQSLIRTLLIYHNHLLIIFRCCLRNISDVDMVLTGFPMRNLRLIVSLNSVMISETLTSRRLSGWCLVSQDVYLVAVTRCKYLFLLFIELWVLCSTLLLNGIGQHIEIIQGYRLPSLDFLWGCSNNGGILYACRTCYIYLR